LQLTIAVELSVVSDSGNHELMNDYFLLIFLRQLSAPVFLQHVSMLAVTLPDLRSESSCIPQRVAVKNMDAVAAEP
jgi:hypothetical protein